MEVISKLAFSVALGRLNSKQKAHLKNLKNISRFGKLIKKSGDNMALCVHRTHFAKAERDCRQAGISNWRVVLTLL